MLIFTNSMAAQEREEPKMKNVKAPKEPMFLSW
jgi:hypothetical protein